MLTGKKNPHRIHTRLAKTALRVRESQLEANMRSGYVSFGKCDQKRPSYMHFEDCL